MISPIADMFLRNILILIATICIISRPCLAELFTAVTDMEGMLDTETVLINNLESYVEAQEEQLNYLRRRIKEYKKEHDEAATDISAYVSNPINAYLLTKRLTSDWKIIEQAMSNDIGNEYLKNVTMHKTFLTFPSDEDLNGAAIALIRLQDTYGLDTASIARGELNGVQYSSQMSSHDCFEMGRQSYLNKDYHHTSLWMKEAMARLNNTGDSTAISRADILEYMAFSIFKQGNIRHALDITNELLAVEPDHDRALGNKVYYEKELYKEAERNADKMLRGDDGSPEFEQPPPIDVNLAARQRYERMCRNDYVQDLKVVATLKCRYKTNTPFLRLAPLKYEEMSLSPYIVVYHEVLSDNEIEVIKRLAKPKFRRATVQNHATGTLEFVNYRISKSGWLRDEEHDVVRAVGVRVQDMTDLSMKSAEELQVVNYGIGGHYEPHFDFARQEETNAFKDLGTGNRIATTLFYMSDVEQGGATAFPEANVALWPKKATAAFWWNLFEDGIGDVRTRHAACPVLAGSKWVCNKWIHQHHQEFLRPCGLQPDHSIYGW